MPRVKLYDLRKKNYPRDVEFRTLQVHTCPTCSSRTNKAMSTGFPGEYLCLICPNVLQEWHTALAELKCALSKVNTINSAKLLLEAGVEKILDTHRDEIRDDIEGNADKSLTW